MHRLILATCSFPDVSIMGDGSYLTEMRKSLQLRSVCDIIVRHLVGKANIAVLIPIYCMCRRREVAHFIDVAEARI